MFEDSLNSLEYTFSESKLSCYRPFYHAHIFFAYMVFLSGIFAFLTRLSPRFHFWHIYIGRFYILSMLWATATSLLIYTTGLPIGVLYSFSIVLVGMSVGWIAINVHTDLLKYGKIKVPSVVGKTRWQILYDRMVTLKAFHGVVMFASWVNIAGRIFVTKLDVEHECFSQPAFKPLTSKLYNYTAGDPIQYVPINSPNYVNQPWANRETSWLLMLLFGPLAGAIFVGVVYVLITTQPKKVDATDAPPAENQPDLVK
jgi:hypothetical protein